MSMDIVIDKVPNARYLYGFISLHIRSMWETICDAQAGFWLNSKFLSKFSRKPLSGISDQKAPLPILENFRFEMTKVYSEIPPPNFGKLQIWDDQRLLQIPPPHFGKLQIWDDQSLLQNIPPPPISENFRFEMTKVYSKIPLPPFRKTSDLRWPKFAPKYPPPNSENPGDRMWRLICNPQGYHSLSTLLFLVLLFPYFCNVYREKPTELACLWNKLQI